MRLVLICAVVLSACGNPSAPRLETAADSLAFDITEGMGGLEAWDKMHGLEWEWAVVRDSVELVRTRHVWDKHGDRVRVEWPGGQDSMWVAVLSPSTFDDAAPTGQVALNGSVVSGPEAAERLTEANGRFINDGYWLYAPIKVLDPGVNREIDPTPMGDRLALTFESVGLTPGDRYWIDVDSGSRSMTGWSYVLEGSDEPESRWTWTDPVTLTTEAGPVTLARMKVAEDEQTIILTEPTALDEIDETEFTDLTPRLGTSTG
ncbi:hypothetical protein [Rubrivirga sp.]|uniref:hypothetical protein n=1 Tax=Rubrivirga sp. TaxID=1885344 RepID=UPI003C773166